MATNATLLTKPQPGRTPGVSAVVNEPSPAERMKEIINGSAKDFRARTVIIPGVTGAKEIIPQMAGSNMGDVTSLDFMGGVQRKAKDLGTTFSEMLEMADPSWMYTGTELEGTDAFDRQLYFAGIRVASDPKKGLYADQVERFFQSNTPGSQVLFPEYINKVMRAAMIAPDILDQLIATTTSIKGDYYRTIYINDTAGQRQMRRVGQGAEIPKTTFTTGERSITLYKYGVTLEGTYEFFRALQIDLFTLFMQRVAIQAMIDRAGAAIDVAINGDGNGNAATNYNQSSLDTGSTPTYAAFLKFQAKFYPYHLNTLVGGETAFVNFLTMARPSIDPFQVLALLQPGKPFAAQEVGLTQGIFTSLNLVYLPTVATGVLVGLDKQFALEQVVEEGASLVETDRLITSQRNQIVISEKVGYDKLYDQATATWTTNA
jgi:hypothetical protein